MKIKRHIPNFIDVDDKIIMEYEFNTLEELSKIKFIKAFSEINNFSGFSIGHTANSKLLMATYKNGSEWWVVGYIDDNINLPDWKENKPGKIL